MNRVDNMQANANSSQVKFWLAGIFVLLLIVCALLIYLIGYVQHDHHRANYTSIFAAIIADASAENTAEDIAPLFAINKGNPLLQWKSIGEEEWLSVLAWMDKDSYRQHYQPLEKSGEIGIIPGGINLWVTATPQLQKFCQQLDLNYKAFRIKQYLGLNPDRRYDTFVQLWVKADDLFRPCPDPEINDRKCNLDFTADTVPTVKNISNYPDYFSSLVKNSYAANGAPWTRLGYTYDWKNNRRNIGASEYILVPGAEFRVSESYSTREYCQ